MNDQTFHTPSFGDEEFDIPVMHHQSAPLQQHHQLDQYQHLHNTQMDMMNEQTAYNQHQWHHQPPTSEPHHMANQTYQLQSPNHSNYHHITSPNQQMLLMQPSSHQPPQQQSMTPQITPQLSVGNYIGQSPGQVARGTENASTSDDSDDTLNDPNSAFKRPSPDPFADGDSPKGSGGKKAKSTAKKTVKKKKDPNEPAKPVSAYALFFRDTQAAIKGQNPNAAFGEISKIVASMWDVLAPEHKEVYKKKTEEAKKDYAKAIAVYRAGSMTQSTGDLPSPPHQTIISPAQSNPLMQQQIPTAASAHQMQASYQNLTPSYQQSFVNQSMINQNLMQPQSNAIYMSQQHGVPNQSCMNQQLHQMNQQTPLQQQQSNITPQQQMNNNQLPSASGNAAIPAQGAQNCIRIGCTNAAIVSNDWEDEYCSNECVITHCRDVFGNWVLSQSGAQQQQSFSAVN